MGRQTSGNQKWGHRLSKFQKPRACARSFLTTLTCHVLCPPDGSGHGRPRDEHSRLEQEWRLSGYNARKCGTTGRLGSATHQPWNDCRPRGHSNETAGWCPTHRERGWWKARSTICTDKHVKQVKVIYEIVVLGRGGSKSGGHKAPRVGLWDHF